ncbi:hypothetical protein OG585_01925 [Streptomyces sp. NBC_01340]|uniref:hypothetical protein n=1 Tax=unclassified Streptomyces TaxID=2593676 RepID=UPI00225AEE0A|nr:MULTISPECIES: hypothetical protein [unclassified Streptomyces]MCX4461913.1 hypothetical protein [Streptomyces sp. NBC_01719]MCX4490821.1 hypothetical protein [Streptomyces sp. NBC_01728]MCX4594598.1 hypothetical protein [Streptomyces sp. NBC_01549]WSI36164.1 hypothetical protein OG585_01925 [Streptomyces sp. NBC_01340]
MPRRDPDKHSDPVAASVSLATEAALLEARLRMLQEEIDTVDARIEAVSESLRLLGRAPSASAEAGDSVDHDGSPGRKDVDGATDGACRDDACRDGAKRSMPCWP